jgi:hypothetical protein
VTPWAEPWPEDTFPIKDDDDIHLDWSTVVLPNLTEIVRSLFEIILPVTVMWIEPDEGTISLLDNARGGAKDIAWVSVAVLLKMNDTPTERDLLDPADTLLVTALFEVQVDDLLMDPLIPTRIETAVSPIPDPNTAA